MALTWIKQRAQCRALAAPSVPSEKVSQLAAAASALGARGFSALSDRRAGSGGNLPALKGRDEDLTEIKPASIPQLAPLRAGLFVGGPREHSLRDNAREALVAELLVAGGHLRLMKWYRGPHRSEWRNRRRQRVLRG